MDISTISLAVIGVGNMGGAIVRALLGQRSRTPERIVLCDALGAHTEPFGSSEHVCVVATPQEAIAHVDAVMIAVKPQDIPTLLTSLCPLPREQLWISIAAGVPISVYKQRLGQPRLKIVRAMPNTPAMVDLGMTGWTASPDVSVEEKDLVRDILTCFGREIEVSSEDDIDKVTALSGSGPAYFFHIVELLTQAGIELGLGAEASSKLAMQTFIGAAALLRATGKTAEELRLQVTSKGGTTHAAIETFKSLGLGAVFTSGVQAAYQRAGELGRAAAQG